MKLFINALLFSSAFAEVARRQSGIQALASAVGGLQEKILAVDKAVVAFNGDAQQAVAIQTAAKALADVIEKGTEQAKALPQLQQQDALGLAEPVQGLGKSINQTIDDLIAKKAIFHQAGLGGAVHEILVGQQASSKAFTETLLGKLPVELQPIGQKLAAPVAASIQRGVDAFAGEKGSVASAEASISGPGSSPSTSSDTKSPGTKSPETMSPGSTSPDTTSTDTSSKPQTYGTAGGYGPPPPPRTNITTPPFGGNQTNQTHPPITTYTGAAPSQQSAASVASAVSLSALLAVVALFAL